MRRQVDPGSVGRSARETPRLVTQVARPRVIDRVPFERTWRATASRVVLAETRPGAFPASIAVHPVASLGVAIRAGARA